MSKEKLIEGSESERTDLFYHIGSRNPNASSIALCARDAGAANALGPVMIELAARDASLFVFTDDPGRSLLLKSGLGLTKDINAADPLVRMAEILGNVDVVVTGYSGTGGPGIELALTANARIDGTPTVWIEDAPGSIFPDYRGRLEVLAGIKPTHLCVMNEWSRWQEEAAAPDLLGNCEIVITGQPAFDALTTENRVEIRRDTRIKLGVSDKEKLVVYMGGPLTEVSTPALEALVKGLEAIDEDYKLVIRRHPRDNSPVETGRIQHATKHIQQHISDSQGMTTDQVGIAADLVVTIDSTEGSKAVYRGIPALHILIPEILDQAELYHSGYPVIPTVEDGASLVVRSVDKMLPILDRIFSGNIEDVRERMKHWQLDGLATQRVTDLILKLAEEQKKKRV